MSIQSVKEKHASLLMRLPNVVGVGIGEKGGSPVIKVFVSRKVPASELKPSDTVPASLEGWPTDVEPIGVVTAQGR